MNFLMMSNIYLPKVGGVQFSIQRFSHAFRERGHEVLIVTPEMPGAPRKEEGVRRVPAIQNFNGTDFSVPLTIPDWLFGEIDRFQPTLVHAHHPFLLGDAALRVASRWDVPLVFTHHTMWEHYTHYVPADSEVIRSFVIRLATDYANLCDHVIAPSGSIRDILQERGVVTPVSVIPTGVWADDFRDGDGARIRRDHDLPEESFVVGYVGRVCPEKNLIFQARAMARFLEEHDSAYWLIVGDGPSRDDVTEVLQQQGVADRCVLTGALQGKDLTDAYHAMDLFAFASKSETQGMVLAEAMTAGVPVVALDAPGSRDVVEDGENGRLVMREDEEAFAEALCEVASWGEEEKHRLQDLARRSAAALSVAHTAEEMLSLYERLIRQRPKSYDAEHNPWQQTLRELQAEWNIWASRTGAIVGGIGDTLGRKSATGEESDST